MTATRGRALWRTADHARTLEFIAAIGFDEVSRKPRISFKMRPQRRAALDFVQEMEKRFRSKPVQAPREKAQPCKGRFRLTGGGVLSYPVAVIAAKRRRTRETRR